METQGMVIAGWILLFLAIGFAAGFCANTMLRRHYIKQKRKEEQIG